LVRWPLLDKAIAVVSPLPIAVLINVIRIVATGLALEKFGSQVAHASFHHAAG
jgi:exosortase/archaeosortase family protein